MVNGLKAAVGSLCLFAGCALAIAAAQPAWAFPVPSRIPTRWELKFEPGPVRLYVDSHTGEKFWYFTYKVTNNTGAERFWAPQLTLFTDGGAIMSAGEGVPPQVESDLINLLGNEYLARHNEVIGKIYVGPSNAIEGLAVWPAADLRATEMTLFVSGISGETAEVRNPETDEREILQKTLRRDYVAPGDPLERGSQPLEFSGEMWVMR